MSNNYFSKTARLFARGIYTGTITPPNDFAVNIVAQGNIALGMFPVNLVNVSSQSAANIKTIGLYSNFADGLVPKNTGESLLLSVTKIGFTAGAALTGTKVNIAASRNALIGTGTLFVGELSVGDYIMLVNRTVPISQRFIYKVKTITDNLNLAIWGYVDPSMIGDYDILKLTPNTYAKNPLVVIAANLEDMFPYEDMVQPYIFTLTLPAGTYTYFGLEANLEVTSNLTVSYLTKSIDTSFAANTCFFDMAIDLEYTPL